jgi:hypothetical protein
MTDAKDSNEDDEEDSESDKSDSDDNSKEEDDDEDDEEDDKKDGEEDDEEDDDTSPTASPPPMGRSRSRRLSRKRHRPCSTSDPRSTRSLRTGALSPSHSHPRSDSRDRHGDRRDERRGGRGRSRSSSPDRSSHVRTRISFATSAALLIVIHVAARALHPAVRRFATTHVPLVAARRVAKILVIATTTAEMTAKATVAARFPPALTPF